MSAKADMSPSSPSVSLPVPGELRRWPVVLALGTLYLVWGSTYLAVWVAVEEFPPLLLTGLRYGLAGVVFFGFLWLRGHPLPTRLEWRNCAIVGTLLMGCGAGSVATAEQLGVASGLAALAVGAVPLWAGLFAGFWERWPSRIEWMGLALGMGGLVLLNLDSNMQSNPLGALVLIFGPACWAFGSVWSRGAALPKGMMAIAAQMLSGGIMTILIGLLLGERMTTMPSTQPLLGALYLAIFGALVGFSAYGYLLHRVRPILATSYAYVNPVIAVILGTIFAAEIITGQTIVAMLVILSGVALVMLGREREKAK